MKAVTELKDIEREISRFQGRLFAAAAFVLLAFSLLAARLVYLQVFRHEELATQAEANRIAVVPIVPNRGLIVDRNGVVLATNYSAYTLEISPRLGRGNGADLDALIDELAGVVTIETRDRRRFKRLQEEMKGAESLPIRTKLSDEEVARFMAQRFRFPGVDVKARLFRNYPLGDVGAHLLGYIGRVNQAEKKAMEDWDEAEQGNYKGTDYIGKLGLEQSYEKVLHGKAGFEEVETSAGGRPVRRLNSHPPTPGDKLVLSIDIRLQALVEELFGDRRGALVAIDPRSGEVLAFVSKPTFDPNLFVDGIDVESWRELNESIDKPLLNRALRGTYPSGSTIKPALALAALVNHDVDPNATRFCGGTYHLPGSSLLFREGRTGRHGAMDLRHAIAKSCDVYFYDLANTIGVDHIAEFLAPLGFGALTGIDISGEKPGLLPSRAWKRKYFKRPAEQVWYPGETVNFGIGQGYFLVTPLQLAHYTSILANRGTSYKPRLVSGVRDPSTGEIKRFAPVKNDEIKTATQEQWQIIMEGMAGTLRYGTASQFAGKNMTYTIAGKTGTAQVFTVGRNEKLDNQKTVSDRLRDHSWFIAFAPAEDPRIAVAVIVENGGFGSSAASPIVRKIMDTYLLDANGQLKVPLPRGTQPLTPGAGYAPITPGKAAPPPPPSETSEEED